VQRARSKRAAAVIGALALGLTITACGSSDDDSPSTPAADDVTTTTAAKRSSDDLPNACKVVSKDDVAAAAGVSLADGIGEGGAGVFTRCNFAIVASGASGYVRITLTNGSTNFEYARDEPGAERVADLGEEAYWVPNSGLSVLVDDVTVYVTISLGGGSLVPGPGTHKPDSIRVARLYVDAL